MGDAKDDVDAEFQERGVNEADSDDEAYDQYVCLFLLSFCSYLGDSF